MEQMRLSAYGELVLFTWNDLVNHILRIELGPFIIMPNHIHDIIQIIEANSVATVIKVKPQLMA